MTVTDAVAVTITERPRIDADGELGDLIQAAAAAGRPLVVVTPARTLVSCAAHAAATRGEWRWVVESDATFWDGLSGRILDFDGTDFSAGDEVAPGIATALAARRPTHVVTAETVHPLTAEVVGHLAEKAAALLGTPLLWGAVEPGSRVLEANALTRAAQASSPDAVHLALTGDEVTGLVTIDPEPAGVVERITLFTSAGPPIDVCSELVAAGAQLATWVARLGDGGHLCPGTLMDPAGIAVSAERVPTIGTDHLTPRPGVGHVWDRPAGDAVEATRSFVAALHDIDAHASWPPRTVNR